MIYHSDFILAIDPGNIESAWVLVDAYTLAPIMKAKEPNEDVLISLEGLFQTDANVKHIAIEMVASYGMAVGASVFETCVWIGRFTQYLNEYAPIQYIYRKDEKMTICHSMKANDATITQALIDRFATNTSNHGKGTKKDPGWFYGFKKDIWQAYAVAVTYHDMYLDGR